VRTIVASPTGWQVDDRPLWARIRRWAISFLERELRNGRLANEGSTFPVALFGNRIIVCRRKLTTMTPWGILVIQQGRATERGTVPTSGKGGLMVFLTHKVADPFGIFHIHTWIVGVPPEVVKFVETRAVA